MAWLVEGLGVGGETSIEDLSRVANRLTEHSTLSTVDPVVTLFENVHETLPKTKACEACSCQLQRLQFSVHLLHPYLSVVLQLVNASKYRAVGMRLMDIAGRRSFATHYDPDLNSISYRISHWNCRGNGEHCKCCVIDY
ncbi:hypothetical protein GQ457_13G006820 [Hibiscus cannabinus]